MSESFCVITFYSTHLALKFERVVKDNGLATKLIPVPRQISSSCGLAGRFAEEKISQVQTLCEQNDVEYDYIYRVYRDKSKKPEKLA